MVVLNGEVMQGQMADMNQFMHKMSAQQQVSSPTHAGPFETYFSS